MKRAREEDLLARVSALCQDADTVTVDMAVDEIREFGFEASVSWVCPFAAALASATPRHNHVF
jgi:hypothetical protein